MNFKSYIQIFGGLMSAGILLSHSVGYSYGLMIENTLSGRQEISFSSIEVQLALLITMLVFMVPFLSIMNFVKPQNVLRIPSSILIIFTGIIKGLAILYKPHSLLSWQIIFVISCILIVISGSFQFLGKTDEFSPNDSRLNETQSMTSLVGVFIGIFIFLAVLRFGYFVIESNKPKVTDYNKTEIKDNDSSNWSPYMGHMNWNAADAKCKSLGMRLPTIEELKVAYSTELTKTWTKDGSYYWSSTPYDVERYYFLDIESCDTYYGYRNYNNYVRCHH